MSSNPNVLLIAADSVPAHRLGCYGRAASLSPCLDSLAAGGVLCESFISAAIPAPVSFAGLIGGQHPVALGMATKETVAELPFGTTLLPQFFLDAGYTTCAFDNLRRHWHWAGRGWEFYVDPGLRHKRAATGRELNLRVIPWLRTNAQERFFLNVHYQDPALASGTDEAVGALDGLVQELISALTDLRLLQKTLIVFVACEGDRHAPGPLSDLRLRVPLIFNWAGRLGAGFRLKEMFQTEDLAPTLLQSAGLPIPSSMKGLGFWKLVTEEQPGGGRDKVFSADCSGAPAWSLRTADRKAVLSGMPGCNSVELFDRTADPGENRNIAAEQPGVADSMRSDLETWITASLEELARNESFLFDDD